MRIFLRLDPLEGCLTLPLHCNHPVQVMIYRGLEGAYIRPVKVSKRNEAIINFKGFWIKGWRDLYKLNLTEPHFTLTYDAGLGPRNNQGFGMVEVVRRRKDDQNATPHS